MLSCAIFRDSAFFPFIAMYTAAKTKLYGSCGSNAAEKERPLGEACRGRQIDQHLRISQELPVTVFRDARGLKNRGADISGNAAEFAYRLRLEDDGVAGIRATSRSAQQAGSDGQHGY